LTDPVRREAHTVELPTTYHIPFTWLMQHGCPAIRYRTLTELFPGSYPAEAEAIRPELEAFGPGRQIVKKQKDTGVWGGNMLGVSPNKATGIKDVGTYHQYLRLVELGWGRESRPLKLGSRLLFRLLSRDPDPKLLFEYVKYSFSEPDVEPWVREMIREAAAAALARSGFGEDPRVRGAAHSAATAVSTFLRSELATQPLVKSGGTWILHPQATPPTIFTVALLAQLPSVQRERAGLIERLGAFLAQPAGKKAFGVQCGKKVLKQTAILLGDPLKVSASGQTDDLPFSLYWMEILARLGLLRSSTSVLKLWARLVRDCDKDGVWRPRNLRALPKRVSPWSYHAFPLEGEAKTVESRQTDVTFRMALIARLAGWDITAS
jgi:hypothetical protein